MFITGNILWPSGSSQILVSRNIFVILLILMVGSRSIHYSSFASHKKSYRPTDSGINLTLLIQQQCKVSIQYNGGLLPEIIPLIQCYYHWGTRLNAVKRFCIFGAYDPI